MFNTHLLNKIVYCILYIAGIRYSKEQQRIVVCLDECAVCVVMVEVLWIDWAKQSEQRSRGEGSWQ